MNRLLNNLFLAIIVLALAIVLPAARVQAIDEIPDGYARLVVITNFDNTEVRLNDVAYPYEWIYGDLEGIFVPAGLPFEVTVATSEESSRTFQVNLDNGETRVLVVDVENMGQTPTAPRRNIRREEPEEEEEADEEGEEEEDVGYLGVSSSPRGIVHVDGTSTNQRTPARRIEVEPGRHEVTVYYDEQEVMSEVKHVLIRSGVNTNVFFRYRGEEE